MRKKFRIRKIDVSDTNKDNPYVFRFKLEQKITLLPFVHFWDSPFFAPPHLFTTEDDAYNYLSEMAKKHSFHFELKDS